MIALLTAHTEYRAYNIIVLVTQLFFFFFFRAKEEFHVGFGLFFLPMI